MGVTLTAADTADTSREAMGEKAKCASMNASRVAGLQGQQWIQFLGIRHGSLHEL